MGPGICILTKLCSDPHSGGRRTTPPESTLVFAVRVLMKEYTWPVLGHHFPLPEMESLGIHTLEEAERFLDNR